MANTATQISRAQGAGAGTTTKGIEVITPELMNKIRALANIAAHLPVDCTVEDEDSAMVAVHADLPADTILELIALASAAQESAPAELPQLPGCLADRLYEAIGIAHHCAQHAGSVPRMKKWDDTKDDLRAALSRPVVISEDDDELAQWVENQGMQVAWANDGDMHHIIKVTPPELRVRLAAALPSPQPVAKGLPEAMKQNMELVIARLQQIAWNNTDDARTLASEALVCAEAVLAASTPTTLTEKKE